VIGGALVMRGSLSYFGNLGTSDSLWVLWRIRMIGHADLAWVRLWCAGAQEAVGGLPRCDAFRCSGWLGLHDAHPSDGCLRSFGALGVYGKLDVHGTLVVIGCVRRSGSLRLLGCS